MISPNSRVHRSPSAAWRELDGEVAIISMDVNRVRLLNKVGAFVWERCDGRTLGDLTNEVRARYGIDVERAERDVRSFVDDMLTRGLVVVEN